MATSMPPTNPNHTTTGSGNAPDIPREGGDQTQSTPQVPTSVPHNTTPPGQPNIPPSSSGRTKFRPRILTFGGDQLPQHLSHSQTSTGKQATATTGELQNVLSRQTDSVTAGHDRVTRRGTLPVQLESAGLKRRSADIAELLKLQSTQGKHDGLDNVRNFSTKLLQLQQKKTGSAASSTDKHTDTPQVSNTDKQSSEGINRSSSEKIHDPTTSLHQGTSMGSASVAPSVQDSFATSKSPSVGQSGSTFSEVERSQPAIPPFLTPPSSATLYDSGHRCSYTPSPSPELQQVAEEDMDSVDEDVEKETEEEEEEEEGKKVKHTVTYKHQQQSKQSKGKQR